MHCASCGATIEDALKKIHGVVSAQTNFGTETVEVVSADVSTNVELFNRALNPLGYTLHPMSSGMDHALHTGVGESKERKLKEIRVLRGKVYLMIPLAIFSGGMMILDAIERIWSVQIVPEFVNQGLLGALFFSALIALFFVGIPYLKGIYRFLRYGKADMDTLIGMGTLAAFLYSVVVMVFPGALGAYIDVSQTYFDVVIVVIAFITLGKYLESRSKVKTGAAIEKLLNLQAKQALVLRQGIEVEVPIEDIRVGDLLIVKPASRIAVDGVIADGSTFVDESMITGEPIPVEKQAGDRVVAGTLNTTGTVTFTATHIGSETLLFQIIKMVETAQSSKAPIQALADKISRVFVPIVLGLAFVSLGLWLTIGIASLGFGHALSFGLTSFVGILIIACPCALGLATPTAIIVGVGKGAREGILIKDAATLQTLHQVTTIVLDKTGTVTKGMPEVVLVHPASVMQEEQFMTLLASLESRSEHPIASAIVAYVKQRVWNVVPPEKFEVVKGKGILGVIGGVDYLVGNAMLMQEYGLEIPIEQIEEETAKGRTPVFLATTTQMLGYVMVADAVRPEAKGAITTLHRLGIRTVMLTGDDERTARFIANQVGVEEVIAHALPGDKLAKISALQKDGEIVAMVGDGMNDAPALAQADVGIAMGTGTDIAMESAGITLLQGDISKLVKAIHLSNLTMRGIKQNLFWAFFYNLVGIPLAGGLFFPLFGWLLSPVFAGIAMAFSSVSVVANSLRLQTKKL